MTIKIERKIVKYQVQKPEDKAAAEKAAAAARPLQAGEPETVRDKNGHTAKVIRMHEKLERPEVLIGSTYKIKTPISDHAMYVTINDIVLNEGTEYEQRRPVRGVHQLEEPRSLPVDRGAHAHHLGRVPQGRRRHLPGR